MGNDDTPRPGFDRWVSFKGQGTYLNPDINEDGKAVKPSGYITDILNGYAVQFIKRRHDKGTKRDRPARQYDWAQPLEGGGPKQLTDLKDQRIVNFAWSRDGKQLALSRGVVNSDVVLISGFR